MSQTFTAAQTIKADGRYCVRATRTSELDALSVYVNRVKKLSSTGNEVTGVLSLETGDAVESTGDLTIEAEV